MALDLLPASGELKKKLLGHSSIQHTANYLGIEEAEALEIARGMRL